MNRHLLVGLLFLLAAASPSHVFAALLAYEPFQYPVTTNPTGNPTNATGFANPWRSIVAGGSIDSPSLTYTDGGGNVLPVRQNKYLTGQGRLFMDLNVAGGGPFAAFLDGAGNVGLDGKTIYVSVLMRNDAGTDAFSAFDFHRDTDADAALRTSIDISTGNHTGGVSDWFLTTWLPNGGGGVSREFEDSVIPGPNANVNMYVIRFDFGAANADTVRVYVNPTLTAPEPLVAAGLIASADLSFDRLSFANFGSGGLLTGDEIRIGDTYASVVPEPSTLLLGAIGAAFFLLQPRRRRAQ